MPENVDLWIAIYCLSALLLLLLLILLRVMADGTKQQSRMMMIEAQLSRMIDVINQDQQIQSMPVSQAEWENQDAIQSLNYAISQYNRLKNEAE